MDILAAEPTAIEWSFRALGFRYSFLLPLSMLVSLALVALVCFRCRSHHLTALLVLLIPLPLFLGMISMFDGWVSSLQVISVSGATPQPSDLALGMAMSLFGVKVGLWLSLPGFLLATVVMVYRALSEPREAEFVTPTMLPTLK
jgi:hypothetical protein